MRHNVLYKYFTFGAALILASFIILGVGMSAQVYKYSVAEKEKSLEYSANRIASMTTEILSQFSSIRQHTFQMLISSTLADASMSAVLCDKSGHVIIASENVPNARDAGIPSQIISKTIKNRYFSSVGALHTLYRSEHFTVGVPYYDHTGQAAGCVFVTSMMSDMRGLLMAIIRIFLLSALVVFFVMLVAAYIGTRSITRPIKRISTAARQFAHGDFAVRVPVKSRDEIGELSQSFNSMAETIEKSEELRRTFVANVSHELRSPMTSIGGYVDGILDGTITPENQNKYLEIISSEVKRLSRLVSRMLNITKLQAEDFSQSAVKYDFCEQVRRVIIGFEPKIAEKNINLNVFFSNDCIELLANEDAIFQVVYNLMENAIKFSEDGSDIDIDVASRGGKLLFSIKNAGKDIPPEEIPYVFDRFHKADKSRGKDKSGLGLGLYIVKTIINQHGGDVGAKSENGETEFYFTLAL